MPPVNFDFLAAPMWWLALGFALVGLLARASAVYRMAAKERRGQPVSNNPLAFMALLPTGIAMLFAFGTDLFAGLVLAAVCMVFYFIAMHIVRGKLDNVGP